MQSSLTDLSGIIQGLGEDYIVEVEGTQITYLLIPRNSLQIGIIISEPSTSQLFESMGVKKNQLSAIAYADTRPKQPNVDSNGCPA